MSKVKLINKLFEDAAHGCDISDIERAFNAGIEYSRSQSVPIVEELLSEAIGWLDEARGCEPSDLCRGGWDVRANEFINREEK